MIFDAVLGAYAKRSTRGQGLVRSFDEALLYGMEDQVRVTQDGKLRFIFKAETEIEV